MGQTDDRIMNNMTKDAVGREMDAEVEVIARPYKKIIKSIKSQDNLSCTCEQ